MIGLSLEKDFVDRLGVQMDRFHWKDDRVAVCRCPYCGDSKKSKTKTRGYFFVNNKTQGYAFKCWNCGISVSLYDMLERYNAGLFSQMKYEYIKSKRFEDRMKQSEPLPQATPTRTQAYVPDLMESYTPIIDLPDSHRAKRYMIEKRMLPLESLKRIYFCEDFRELALEIDPSKEKMKENEPRIVFPLYTRDKILFGVSARCIESDSEVRYITIKKPSYKKHEKVYGLERFNTDIPGYCVEGALDAEFLPNCIATTGAGLSKYSNITMVFDNEPRNKEIVGMMMKGIFAGNKVCLWGLEYPYKDVNEGIQNGWTSEEICNHIEKNSFSGLAARAKMASWSKC